MDVASESIYNLIPKPKQEACKKRIYRSKYDPKAPLSGSTFGLHGTTVTVGKGINELKKTCVISSTFGPTQMKPDPSKFLRRKSQNLPKTGKCFRRAPVGQKPPVPSCDDKPIMGLRSSKNYIVSNATQAIIQEPKGLKEEEKSFLKKETYGKVPEYLKKVKKEVQREKEVVEFCVKEKANEPEEEEYIMFDEMERQHLIYSLKRKWDDVNSTYQKICHRVSINSLGDIKRKEAQEAELQQLEDDIQRLSRPGPLYIKKS